MSNQAFVALQAVVFIVLLPFYLAYDYSAKRQCVRDGGHYWRNDWPDVSERTIEVYDHCENCPASRRMKFSPKRANREGES